MTEMRDRKGRAPGHGGRSAALPPVLAGLDAAALIPGGAPREDDGLLSSAPPGIGVAEAAGLAERIFGLRGEVFALSSERDSNFRIRLQDGTQALLKVSNAAEDRAVTAMQTAALIYIAAVDPDLPVQRVHATRDGNAWAEITGPSGARHVVRLVSFLDGDMLHAVTPAPGLHADIGRRLAQLCRSLRGFFHPASDRVLLWDIKQVPRLRPLLDAVRDAPEHDALQAQVDRFDDRIGPALPGLRWQVVHNDFNPHNLVVDAGTHGHLTGVIDFGDMVFTPLACDLAIACSYQLRSGADPLADVRALVAGYAAVLPLEDEELSLLPELIRLRHVTTLVIANWRAKRYPENAAYILRNAAASRVGLTVIEEMGTAAVAAELRGAIGRAQDGQKETGRR